MTETQTDKAAGEFEKKYGMTNEELLERYSNLSVDDYKELLEGHEFYYKLSEFYKKSWKDSRKAWKSLYEIYKEVVE